MPIYSTDSVRHLNAVEEANRIHPNAAVASTETKEIYVFATTTEPLSNDADGSAEFPFSRLEGDAWAAIDAALESHNVIVYMNARNVDDDNDAQHGVVSRVERRDDDERKRWLILDGYSKWRDASGAWKMYNGASKATLDGSPEVLTSFEQNVNRFRVQGLKLNGRFHLFGLRFIQLVDSIVVGRVTFGYAFHVNGELSNGGGQGIFIANNLISNPQRLNNGECIYIGGSNDMRKPAHRDVRVQNNLISDCSDGIDLKDELLPPVRVSGNVVHHCSKVGIISHSPVNITENAVFECEDAISLSTEWGGPFVRPALIRNNLLVNSRDNGVQTAGEGENTINELYVQLNTIVGFSRHALALWHPEQSLASIVEHNLVVSNVSALTQDELDKDWLSSLSPTQQRTNVPLTGEAASNALVAMRVQQAGFAYPRASASAITNQPVESPAASFLSLASVDTDLRGKPRASGTRLDVGCFEASGESDLPAAWDMVDANNVQGSLERPVASPQTIFVFILCVVGACIVIALIAFCWTRKKRQL